MFHHLLTPGSGGYAVLKFGTVAGVVGLRFAVSRRSKQPGKPAEPAPDVPAESPRRTPHPRSKKKRSRRP